MFKRLPHLLLVSLLILLLVVVLHKRQSTDQRKPKTMFQLCGKNVLLDSLRVARTDTSEYEFQKHQLIFLFLETEKNH